MLDKEVNTVEPLPRSEYEQYNLEIYPDIGFLVGIETLSKYIIEHESLAVASPKRDLATLELA